MNAFLHFVGFGIAAFFIISALVFIFIILRNEGVHWREQYRRHRRASQDFRNVERMNRDIQRNR